MIIATAIIINKLFKQFSKNLDMKANKFIVKLLEMMKEFPQIINWSTDGAEIEVSDIQRFSAEVHPRFFTTSNYQSFLRQLNMYGFKKMGKRRNAVSFTHSDFRRGNDSRFHHIRRRQQKPHEREAQALHLLASSEIDDNPTALAAPPSLNHQIRQTLALIKKQATDKGALLVQKLERMLERTAGRAGATSQAKGLEGSSAEQLRQYVSFCRLEEVLVQRGELYGCEFNFQSGNFNHSLYFQQ